MALKLSGVKRIIQLEHKDTGVEPVTIYKKPRSKKRRVSPLLRPIEKAQRRSLDASTTFHNRLQKLHDKSSRKRRDGWLRDMFSNYADAGSKAARRLTR
jgi:Family of unknown function (DUF6312)